MYNPIFLENASDLDITFTTNIDIVLEMILFKVREVTIRYASSLKRARNTEKKSLQRKIEELEQNECDPESQDKLEKFKQDLVSELKGQIIRSRAQWLHSGEKQTQYFCNLVRKNFLDKTIRFA